MQDAFNARVIRFLSQTKYKRMETPAERDAVYQLRYNCYLREGAIEPRSDRILRDEFDEAPNTLLYGIFHNDRLASSIRINILSLSCPSSPALSAFPDALGSLV